MYMDRFTNKHNFYTNVQNDLAYSCQTFPLNNMI